MIKFAGVCVITSIAALCAADSVFAAQNVANPTQKGSLLIWPLITVEKPKGDNGQRDTLIEISNDGLLSIHVVCTYVNERKGRVNFDFDLTAKQTASWDVGKGVGDQVQPPPFPTNPGTPSFQGDPRRGELICFATNIGRLFQVAWNQLTGTATVINLNDPAARQPRQAFKYNAWSFAARDANGPAPDNKKVSHGTPGVLALTGAAGGYDACPAYNIANFMPNGAILGNIATLDNDLSVAGCKQDLREVYRLHKTKLDFTVWNSFESSFAGTYACVDSVKTVGLGVNPEVTQGSNFNFSTLKTRNARFEVRGISVPTPTCPFSTEATGVLGILASSTGIAGTDEDVELGNAIHGAGVDPSGFVLWDFASGPGGGPQ